VQNASEKSLEDFLLRLIYATRTGPYRRGYPGMRS